MLDAQQWLIDLMVYDLSRVVGGIIILILLIEVIERFKNWIEDVS